MALAPGGTGRLQLPGALGRDPGSTASPDEALPRRCPGVSRMRAQDRGILARSSLLLGQKNPLVGREGDTFTAAKHPGDLRGREDYITETRDGRVRGSLRTEDQEASKGHPWGLPPCLCCPEALLCSLQSSAFYWFYHRLSFENIPSNAKGSGLFIHTYK